MGTKIVMTGDKGLATQFIRIGRNLIEELNASLQELAPEERVGVRRKIFGNVTVEATLTGLVGEIRIDAPVSVGEVIEIKEPVEPVEPADCFLPQIPEGMYLTDIIGLPMENMIRITPDFGFYRDDEAPSDLRIEDTGGEYTENWWFYSQDPKMMYREGILGQSTPRLGKLGYHMGFNVRFGDAEFNSVNYIATDPHVRLGHISSYDDHYFVGELENEDPYSVFPPPITDNPYFYLAIVPYDYFGVLDGVIWGIWNPEPPYPVNYYGIWQLPEAYSQVYIWRGKIRRGNNERKVFIITYHQLGIDWYLSSNFCPSEYSMSYRARYTDFGSMDCSLYGGNTYGDRHFNCQIVIVDDKVVNVMSGMSKKCNAAIGISYKSIGFEYDWTDPDDAPDELGYTISAYLQLRASASSPDVSQWQLNNKYNESSTLLSSLENTTHWFTFSHADGSIVSYPDTWVEE